MKNFTRNFLQPAAGDFEHSQKTVFLTSILLVTGIITPVFAVINLLFQAYPTASALGLLSVFCMFGLALIHKRRERFVSISFSILAYGVTFFNLYDGDSLYDSGILTLPILIMVLGYLYGKKTIPLIAAVVLASVLALAYLESIGWIHPAHLASPSRVIVIGLLLVLTAVMQWVITNNWEILVGRIRESGKELEGIARECGQAQREVQVLNAQLEDRVLERTAQLEAANSALQSFGYSVSHDLRAPVRRIEGFTSILLADYSGSMNADCLEQLRAIHRNAVQMDALIQGMLSLGRLSQNGIHRSRVDLSEIARSIAAELRETNPGRTVDFLIADGLHAMADPALMRDALDNLIRNSWKFTEKQPSARIEIGAQLSRGETVFLVRDNGVGFDMAQVDALFEPFQRLHPDREFTGIGVGLPTVQRIIQGHGGRIWAESAVNQGATFFFTLPGEGQRPAG